MSLMFIMCLAGCEREEKTELHFYTKPNVNYQMAYIIYEIYGDPTKIIDGFYFEKNDIVLNIKYGWNEARIESLLNSVDNKQYELICFASYIYLERQPSNSICDDYKNFEKSILIEEIDKEVFLSDYYKANLGESNFFNSKPPIFSKENEGIKLKLTPEYINWIEESTENYSKNFILQLFQFIMIQSIISTYWTLVVSMMVLKLNTIMTKKKISIYVCKIKKAI